MVKACFNVVLFTYRPWEVDLKNNKNSFGFDLSSLQIFRDFFPKDRPLSIKKILLDATVENAVNLCLDMMTEF